MSLHQGDNRPLFRPLIFVLGFAGKTTSSLHLLEEPKDLIFLNTMPSKLKCIADGYPTPKITWIDENDSLIQNIDNLLTVGSNELLFSAFLPNQYDVNVHKKKYRCRVSNDIGTVVSRLVNVKAVIDKRYSPIVHHQSAPIGGSAIFKCVLPEDQSDYIKVYAWHITYPGGAKTRTVLSGMSMDSYHSLTTGQLVVSGVVKLHEEYSFSCISLNTLNNVTLTSSKAKLFPNEPEPFIPQTFVLPKDNINIYGGNTLVLNCDASSYPLPEFTWYKNNQRLKSSDRIKTITGGSIKILRSTSQDQGDYACVIEYKDGAEHEETITLKSKVVVRDPLIFTEVPKQTFTSSGQTINFNCQAKGSTTYTIEWRKDGSLLLSNNHLTISEEGKTLSLKSVTLNDEGVYQCVIKDLYEEIQVAARLIIDAMLPAVQSITPRQKIKTNVPVSLTCACTGQPEPKITWYQDDVIVETGDEISIVETIGVNNGIKSVLTIRSIQTKSSGVYKCIAVNRAGKDVAKTNIEVEGIPTIINFPINTVGVSGRSLYIDCNAKGFPKVTHIWYKNGIPVQASDRIIIHPNGTLVLKGFSGNDIGKYWCIVDNSYGKTRANVAVGVLDPPNLTPFALTPVLVGRRAQYLCTNNGGDGELKWRKNGLDVKSGNGIKIVALPPYAKIIAFERVKITDRGRYSCVATNDAGTATHSADLIVYEKPSFTLIPPPTITVRNAHPIQLVCSATGFPTPQITWYKMTDGDLLNAVRLDHRIKQLGNGTLVISAAHATDTGKYICQASFFDKTYVPDPISKEVQVDVRVPAKIVSTSPRLARNLKNLAINLFCSIIGTPVLSLQWFKDGLKIADDSNKYEIYETLSHDTKPPTLNSTIQIRDLTQADNGKYECMGSNMYDSETIEFQVFVEEPPHEPTTIKEVVSTSRTIKMSWKPGYDGNSPIIYYRVQMKDPKGSWDFGKDFLVNGNKTEYFVSGLDPGQEYVFRVHSRNTHGISDWSEEVILKTMEEAPSGPPRNVTVKAIAKDKLYIQWKEPDTSLQNGIIIFYTIFYTPQVSRGQRQNITTRYNEHFTLRDLLQFTKYEIRVQASTSAGGGPLSGPITDATLEGVPTRPPSNVDIRSTSSDTILIDWKAVPSEYINGLLMGYKVIYTDIERRKTYEKTVINTMSCQLVNLRKYTRYRVAVLAFTGAGDGILSEYMVVRTKEDVPDKPSRFTTTAASPSDILVTWSQPIHPNGVILHYTLYYQASESVAISRENVQAEDTSHMLTDMTLGSNYSIWMTASTKKGEGPSTKKSTATTSLDVPAKIITPSGLVLKRKINSNVRLPCAAVGYPRPSIVWFRRLQTDNKKQKRWMAADVPKELYKITKDDAGDYNCSAGNKYGSDWNVITLVVQFPPEPPDVLDAKVVGEYSINVTWQPPITQKARGYSLLTQHYVNFIVDDGNIDPKNLKWREFVVPAEQNWFVVHNITRHIVFFRIASENSAGVGQKSLAVKFEIAGRGVGKFPTLILPIKKEKETKSFAFLKPILIALVALTTIIILMLFIASWDREERRMRKPRCHRLVLCKCTCNRKRAFNDDPYGEPHLPWPWNIKSNRHSGVFDMNDELLGSSEEQLEFKYAPNYDDARNNPNTNSLKKKFDATNNYDFQPVVLFKANSPNKLEDDGNDVKNNDGLHPSLRRNLQQDDVRRPSYNAHCNKPDIIEKYLRSQELLQDENYVNEYTSNPRESILSEDSIDLDLPPAPPPLDILRPQGGRKISRGSADGKSSDYPSPPEYDEIQHKNNYNTDAPRVLFRGKSPSRRKNRKSLDSLLLKTLEDIEEKQVLTNDTVADKEALEQHAANVIRELLAHPPRHYDSVSSTCSSSVGELRRAFEFGKKYNLQEYKIPDFMPEYDVDNFYDDGDDDEEEEELDYQAHEQLLNALDITKFSEGPRDMNDVKITIPLPIRLASEAQDDDIVSSDDELGIGGGYDRGEQSLV